MSNLWACHTCAMIGSEAEAKAHYIARGHDTEELSQEVSDGIRDQWREQQAQRAVAFAQYAKRGYVG